MFNIFNSRVFVEIGEAIGNIGEKVMLRRRSAADQVDEAFRKRMKESRPVEIPIRQQSPVEPEEDVIDVSFVVLPPDEKEVIR